MLKKKKKTKSVYFKKFYIQQYILYMALLLGEVINIEKPYYENILRNLISTCGSTQGGESKYTMQNLTN